MDDCRECVPAGLRFSPTEEELVRIYLLRKVLDLSNDIFTIPICDLYGEKNPWDLWENLKGSKNFNGSEVYVVTKLKKKSMKGSRVDRCIGLGCWSSEDSPKPIYSLKNPELKIGSRKRFRFEKSGTEQDGGWIMLEYSLDQSWLKKVASNHQNIVNDLVICKFKKNPRRQSQSLPIAAVAVSADTDEEKNNKNKGKKRKLQGQGEEVSENNKKLREGGKADHQVTNKQVLLNKDPHSHSDESVIVVEDDDDQSKGKYKINNQVMVDDPLSFSADEFQFLRYMLEEDLMQPHDERSENQQVIVDNQFQNWDENMCFDFDWLYTIDPDLAPRMDELGYLHPLTATAATATAAAAAAAKVL